MSVCSVSAAGPDLVNIKAVDASIEVDLRYAGKRNLAGRALYPKDMPAFVRPHVAAQLAKAQAILRQSGYGLKIWDAYRPQSAHAELWAYAPSGDYVADPNGGGSLHTCGVAVDVTLVTLRGREVAMPTDFDEFSPAAMLQYRGGDPDVRRNLYRLQNAMSQAGFYGMRHEWWHFVSKEWKGYAPIPEITVVSNGQRAAAAVPPRSSGATSKKP